MEENHLNNQDLKQLLKEYEQKRESAQIKCEEKINKLYDENPKLSKIVDDINKTSIELSKSILLSNKEKTISLQENLKKLKKDKNKLLKDLNISDSFFKPEYECKKCNDTGYLINDGNIMCSCLKQRLINVQYNKSNIYNLEKDSFENFNDNLLSNKPDEKKYNSTLSPRDNIKNIKEIAMKFIENFDDPNEKNLLFTGNTGLGKTYLSNCIANEILKQGKTVLYQTAPIMLDAIIDYRFGKTDGFIYNNILNSDLLIIDDLGTENLNGLKFTELFNVINTRILNQNNHITKTIISTNLSLNNLFQNYDERIFSRLAGYYNICRFYGDDIRINKR